MELKVNRAAIAAAMTALKVNQSQLAERAGVSPALVSRLLNTDTTKRRRTRPSYEAIVRIARALNHAPDVLFPVDDPTTRAPKGPHRLPAVPA